MGCISKLENDVGKKKVSSMNLVIRVIYNSIGYKLLLFCISVIQCFICNFVGVTLSVSDLFLHMILKWEGMPIFLGNPFIAIPYRR